MALNDIRVDQPPEAVFELLMDPPCYPEWVVGARKIRAVDDDWPAVGSRFHHSVALGPLSLKDSTLIEELEPDRRLVLRTRARPLGVARVEIWLQPENGGTRVTMEENPVSGPLEKGFNRLFDATLLRGRNQESLRRLKRLAETA